MSPRDEFAAAALTALLSKMGGDASLIVEQAYILADEMIRQQKPCADNFEIFEQACAVSDAWSLEMSRTTNLEVENLHVLLNRLEEATRPRAMRKVRP